MIKVKFETEYTYKSPYTKENFMATIKVSIPTDKNERLPELLIHPDVMFFGFFLTTTWGDMISTNKTIVYAYRVEVGDVIDALEMRVNSLITMEKNRLTNIYNMNKLKLLPKPKISILTLE